ncbi:MAG: hypothetical protein WC028_02875 [Candidatus Obscuribacterales bacterium]
MSGSVHLTNLLTSLRAALEKLSAPSMPIWNQEHYGATQVTLTLTESATGCTSSFVDWSNVMSSYVVPEPEELSEETF